MTFDLERFVRAQQGTYPGAVAELRSGRKTGHWIWFVFPQIAGLGRSENSWRYAMGSLDEARAYLAHPILGERLRECAGILVATTGRTATDIFGALDATKVRSSMTLFDRADPDEPAFRLVGARLFPQGPDELTDAMLRALDMGANAMASAAREGFDLRLRPETPVIPGDEDPPAPGDQVMTRSATWFTLGSLIPGWAAVGCSWINLRFGIEEDGSSIIRYEGHPSGHPILAGTTPAFNGGFDLHRLVPRDEFKWRTDRSGPSASKDALLGEG